MKILILIVLLVYNAFGQNNWQPLDSPSGADVNNIFKVNDSILMCGIHNGSLYRSTDSGNNWIKVFNGTNGNYNKGVRSFIFNSAQEILVSTFENGIRRSTDLGLTWLSTNAGGGEEMTNTRSGIMFAYDNVHSNWSFAKSIDSGKTWSYIPPWWSNSISSLSSLEDTVYVAYGSTIICSKDFGSTWESYGSILTGAGNINDVFFSSDSEVIAGTNNGIYYSSDRGLSWEIRNNGILTNKKKINSIKLFGDSLFACSVSGLYFSTNKGNQWIHVNNYSYQKDIYNFEIIDNKIIVAYATGVFLIEPDKWINKSRGIYKFTPTSISIDPIGNIIYNTKMGLFRSTNQGNTWDQIEQDLLTFGCNKIIWKDNTYLLSLGASFYASSDYGYGWILSGQAPMGCTDMIFSSINNSVYAALFRYSPPPSGGGLYKSENLGANWTYLNNYNIISSLRGLTNDTLIAKCLNGMIEIYNSGFNWQIINNGLGDIIVNYLEKDKNNNVYVSNDYGIYKFNKSASEWENISDSTMMNVSFIFNNNNYPVVIYNQKIFGSVDFRRWSYASEGIDDVKILLTLMDSLGYYYVADIDGRLYKTIYPHLINKLPETPELIFPINNQLVSIDSVQMQWSYTFPLVTEYEVNISTDTSFTINIDTLVSDTFFYFKNLEANKKYYWRVRAFNEVGWGSYSDNNSFNTGLTDVNDEHIIFTEFSLSQNYPNPFNPSTKISWQSPVGSHQTLKVYDVLGREVAKLVDEFRDAGRYEIEFQSAVGNRQLASGVYYYQLKVGEFIQTKKMQVLK